MTCNGQRDILGLWAGAGGEGAKHWLHVLTELKNRGVHGVPMVVCDGLTGLPDAIAAVWPHNPAGHMRRPRPADSSLLTSAYRTREHRRRRAEASHDHPVPSPGQPNLEAEGRRGRRPVRRVADR